MKIEGPRHKPDNADYDLECQEAMDVAARDLVDLAVQAGWSPRVVYKALEEVARNQAMAYEADPDPADDRL
ncbi:hypothetical protein [Agrobacterium radiobacter]|uniref:hypothetical protein n=1 Tax=Agrobacterium radiobacter TaxID=362 RepID=UPI003CE488BD